MATDDNKRQEKRDRIGRLRTRLDGLKSKTSNADIAVLIGIFKGMLELMADET